MTIKGLNACIETIKTNDNIKKIKIYKNLKIVKKSEIEKLAKNKQIQLVYVDEKNTKAQGIEVIVELELDQTNLENYLVESFSEEKNIILILDRIQDPQNLGAIIRSAAAFNVSAIILPKNNCVSINETVIKTSAGCINYLKIIYVTNISDSIEKLKKADFWIYGTDVENGKNFLDEKFDKKSALVIGNEGSGIRQKVKEKCDIMLNINMKEKINSLNVSVASGIILSKMYNEVFKS